MACVGCGDNKSNRYDSPNTGVAEGETPKHQDSKTPPFDEVFAEVNTYSLKTLLAMKADVREDEEKRYKEMLTHMSEDIIALKVITFVKIFNGEEYSQEGHSPQYCLEMLNAMLDFEDTAKVFNKFDGLAEQIRKYYTILESSRIKITLNK